MKSKIFAVCMVMALLLTCMFAVPTQAATVAAAGRVIANGDFSDGAVGWSIPSSSSNGGIEEDNGNKYGTLKKVGFIISSPMAVTPGETIKWEFDVKSTMQSRFWVRYFDANGEYHDNPANSSAQYHVTYVPANDGTWTRQTVSCKVPDGMVQAAFVFNTFTNAYNTAVNSGVEDIYASVDNVIAFYTLTKDEAIHNGDMEIVRDGMPEGYTVSGTNCTIETVTKHSGKTALKITNTEDTTAYVSKKVYAVSSGGSEPATDFSAYMNLTEFEDDTTDTEDGVRLELYYGGVLKNNTGWFTKTKYEDETPMGWRKMMICWDYVRNTGEFELRVTLNGKGTVYVDDFYTESATDVIRNGDFEGFITDYKAARWSTSTTMTWGENGNLVVIREPGTDNHYLKLINTTKNNYGVKQTNYKSPGMTANKRYKLTADVMGANWDAALTAPGISFNGEGYGGVGASGNNGTEWFRDFTVYFAATAATHEFTFVERDAKASNEAVGTCFDNIEIVPVECETAFYDADGNKVTKAEAGKTYTAKYVGYGENYSTTTESDPVSLIYALYEKMEDGSVRLVSVKLEKGTAKYQDVTPFKSNVYSLVAENAITAVGYTPLELNTSAITIPNDGKSYELRAYTWDDFTNMTPYYASISA